MTNEEKYQNAKKLICEDKARILRENGWEESWGDDNWVRSDSTHKEANTGVPLETAYNHLMRQRYPEEVAPAGSMTVTGFNQKYRQYLEEGHYGLDINDPRVIAYLDEKFQELIKVPGFSYSQIKLKFGMSRVYCEPHEINTSEIKKEIDKILKNEI